MYPMRDVIVAVKMIRQPEPGDVRQFGGNYFFRWCLIAQQQGAHFTEFEIGLAGDDIIRQGHDGLRLQFVTHLGTAKDNDRFRGHTLDGRNDFAGFLHVPDVNAKANDARLPGQQHFGDVERALVNIELHDAGARLQVAKVRHQIAQPKRRVDVLGV
jgi:hypothetical protein